MRWLADFHLKNQKYQLTGGLFMKRTFIAIVLSIMLTFLCGCEGLSVIPSTTSEFTTSTAKMEVYEDSINELQQTTPKMPVDNVTEETTKTTTETHTTMVVTTEVTTAVTIECTDFVETDLEAPPMPTQAETESYSVYYVRTGDWFARIAGMYGIEMDYLALFNNMSVDDTIYPGDEIKIPSGYSIKSGNTKDSQAEGTDGLVQYGCETKTSYSASSSSFTNMEVASDVLTNQVAYIPPGGDFSWLRDVGPCTSSPYVESTGYSGGEVVMVYGGGICMTASALKVAAMRAGCVITETYPHSMPVAYNDRNKPDWKDYESAIDASGSDLCFYNPSQTTGLTIRVVTDRNSHTCMAELIPD